MAKLLKIKHLKKTLWKGHKVEAFIAMGHYQCIEQIFENAREIPRKYDNCYISYIAYGKADCDGKSDVIMIDAYKSYRTALEHNKNVDDDYTKGGKQ